MKAFAVAAVVAAAGVAAQAPANCALTSIPACALPAIQGAIKTGTTCAVEDFVCVCNNQQALTGAATPGVLKDCGQDVAIGQVLPAVTDFCTAQLSGKCSTGSGSSSISSSSAPTTSEAPPPASTSTYPTITEAPPATTSKGPAPTSTPPVTAGAALVGSIGSFGMLVLGALAAF